MNPEQPASTLSAMMGNLISSMGAASARATGVLAQVAGPGEYLSLVKIGVVAVLFIGWCFVCQWVDRDADYVKTRREQWNLIVVSGGTVGVLVWLLLPWKGSLFYLGMAFWLLLSAVSSLAYVIHRNGRVVARSRVMTLGHFKRLIGGGGDKKERVDKGQRVKLVDHEGSGVDAPEEPEVYDEYASTQDFLFDALWRRSSEIDLVAAKDQPRLVYRIDGVPLEQKDRVTPDDADRVISFVKRIAGLNPEERRRPQKGKMRASLLAAPGEPDVVEVVTSGSTSGERMRLTIRPREGLKRLGTLGLSDADREKIRGWCEAPSGLVLFTGPKKSGVTTTQYAVIRDHDAFMQNLHTLETQPLLELDNITQNKHEGASEDVSFARRLQSVLRREPDVVLVGECPDRETAQICCRSAAGERKIYLALEAKDAFEGLEKYRQLVGDDATLAQGLLGFMGQRMMRVICPTCRQSFKPDNELLRKLNLPRKDEVEFVRPPTEPQLDKRGKEILCQTCQGTGYVGRTGVYEILTVDDETRKLIAGGAPTRAIKDHFRGRKNVDITRAAIQKVYEQVSSVDEMLRCLRMNSG